MLDSNNEMGLLCSRVAVCNIGMIEHLVEIIDVQSYQHDGNKIKSNRQEEHILCGFREVFLW